MTASEKLDVLNKWLFLKFPDRKKMGLVLGFKYFKDVKKHVVTVAPCDESIEWMFKVGNAEERRLADTEDEALEAWIREGEDLFGLQAPSFEGMLMELAVAGVEEEGEEDESKKS